MARAQIDPDKRDKFWKERVWRERQSAKEWEKDLGIKEIYQMVRKLQGSLPNNLSVFSDCFPNTTNQVYGSRLKTALADELLRQERVTPWYISRHKRKSDPEMLPF